LNGLSGVATVRFAGGAGSGGWRGLMQGAHRASVGDVQREHDNFRPARWVSRTAELSRLVEKRTARPLVRLDESDVRERVARRVGRPVDGDDPGLRILLADAAQAGLTPLGRAWLRDQLVRRGATAELIDDEVRRRPEILDTPLRRPLVVVGLPRTGTTLLHALLGRDPEAFVLPFWQLRDPYPLPAAGPHRPARVAKAALLARAARSMAPTLPDIHPVAALRPEEDVFLLRDSGMLATPVAAPGYLGWLQEADAAPDYRRYHRHLQALLHDRPHRRVVLKSPFHLGRLEALLAAVPEATVVQTHRDPGVAVASWCSLAAVLSGAASDRVDLAALGRRWLEFWAAESHRAVTARPTVDPAKIYDVRYESLVAEPLAEVERLYRRIGLQLRDPARRRMTSWLRRHHRGRVSAHRYALADFALDREEVDRRFGRYLDWAGTRGLVDLP
jgi:Sulfotransferase family